MIQSAINAQAPSKILIVGSGAIGLLWYSHFHLTNNKDNIVFLYQSLARQPVPQTVFFTDINKNIHTIPTNIFSPNVKQTCTNNTLVQPFDLILVCVKSYQLNEAISDILPLISSNTRVITSNNGLGALNQEHREFLAQHHILNLLTTHGCFKTHPDSIKHTGLGTSDLGEQLGQLNTASKQAIVQLLNSTMPEVVWHENLLVKQWTKLAVNCVINPITALENIPNGDILKPRFNQIIDDVLEEVVTLACLCTIELDIKYLKETVLLVAQKTANNSSSMRCDVNEGRTTEIGYINGYIHQLGIEKSVLTKKNTELYQRILAL